VSYLKFFTKPFIQYVQPIQYFWKDVNFFVNVPAGGGLDLAFSVNTVTFILLVVVSALELW
jgi:hypothetical protein